MKFYFFLLTFFALSILPAYAQIGEVESQQNVEREEGPSVEEERQSLRYIPATHANLSQLMWKYNIYDKKNEDAIDSFLRTRNCRLYEKYYGDEFIWENIRQGIRREIDYYAGDYPERFKIVTYIKLGRYNFSDLAFEVEEHFQLIEDGAIVFPFAKFADFGCIGHYASDDFPEIMKFIPDNKFTLTQIPIPPDQADALIENVKNYRYDHNVSERGLTMTMNVKINSTEDEIDFKNRYPMIVFNGQIDEIVVYEDPQMTKPVWTKSFTDLQ